MSNEQRVMLERWARSTVEPHRSVVQARALLLAAEGVANEEIARRCETTPDTVRRWRARFTDTGVDGVGVIAPGRGRKREISPITVKAIVNDTLHAVPDDGSACWSTRSLGAKHGVGKDTVQRIWKARNLRWNDDPQPFVWTKTVDDIITKVKRGRATLDRITESATDH